MCFINNYRLETTIHKMRFDTNYIGNSTDAPAYRTSPWVGLPASNAGISFSVAACHTIFAMPTENLETMRNANGRTTSSTATWSPKPV